MEKLNKQNKAENSTSKPVLSAALRLDTSSATSTAEKVYTGKEIINII